MSWNDLTGKTFGNLYVEKFSHKDKDRVKFYQCKCKCGNTLIVRGVFLKSGTIASCGCPVEAVVEEPAPAPITVGQKVRFDPFLETTGFSSEDFRGNYVTGVVVYVNEPHKVFWVEYGKAKLRTSFKFCDIGKEVTLRK